MAVLVTGGAGFIGSHTCSELLSRGHDIVVVDNYSNSSPRALDAVSGITGRSFASYELDLRDSHALSKVFDRHEIESVIHFAAKKAVGESTQIPLEYFDVNIGGTISLLRVMLDHEVARLVFSSSCSVYGGGHSERITEDHQPGPTNPYARSKSMSEQMLADVCSRHEQFSVVSLRYFNPIGAHAGGLLGESPLGMPNNILPYLMQVAAGSLEKVRIFGDDYPTADGTGVRDYIHVMDVADAHRVALERLDGVSGMKVFNLGTGTGVSVLELIALCREVTGAAIPYEVTGRRPGDVASLVADPSRIEKEWGWRAARDVPAMCRDAWRFQQGHPHGYVG